MRQVPTSIGGHSPYLRAIAGHGLPGSVLDLPLEPLVDQDFISLHKAVRVQKLTGLLWAAITEGSFPVTDFQRERAQESHLKMLAGVLLLEELLIDTLSVLRRSGVPVRALKGVAMAHLDYPDPAQRTFGDVDLLVPGPEFDAAVAALEASGCTRQFPEPRPGFDRRFSKGTCLRTSDGLEIDLHRTFSMGPFGERLALPKLWEGSERFELAGCAVDALPVEARVLHAAYHFVLGDRAPRLGPLRDLAQMLLTRTTDTERLHELMRESRGEAVVARAVRAAWRELNLADVLAVSAWAEAYRENERAVADLSVYGTESTYAATSIATVRAIPSLPQKARFLLALTLPDRSYLGGRHNNRRQRLTRGLADIRRTRSGR